MRLQMQEVEICLLLRVAGFSFTDGVRRSAKWRRIFFHTERSQMRCTVYLSVCWEHLGVLLDKLEVVA